MIYQAKIYTAAPDGGVTQFSGSALVLSDSRSKAYDKAMEHWHDFIKAEGNVYVLLLDEIDAEVIIP